MLAEAPIGNKPYDILFTRAEIERRTLAVASQIQRTFPHTSPILLPVANGAYRYVNDLTRAFQAMRNPVYPVRMEFIHGSSYVGEESSGEVQLHVNFEKLERFGPPEENLIILVEDVLETGLTLSVAQSALEERGYFVKSTVCVRKPSNLRKTNPPFEATWHAFDLPTNRYIVGYGMDDADGYNRALDHIIAFK